VSFNHLLGDESVKLRSGHAASLPAEAFTLNATPPCDAAPSSVALRFDGVQLNRAPRVLALSNVMSRADGNDTLLVINRLSGDFTAQSAPLGELSGVLFDGAQNALSFAVNAAACQFIAPLNDDFPRVTPPFAETIPALRSGWLKLWTANETAIFGAAMNANANGIGQGHSLHKLTAAQFVSLTMPIWPPPFDLR
jgi:hypothetical protein